MSQASPLADSVRVRLRAMIASDGERHAIARLGIGRQTFARALAGLPVYAGTAALIRERLDAYDRGKL